MRTGVVYYRDRKAGFLTETEEGYEFVYEAGYLSDATQPAISLTLPKRAEPYRSEGLFSFFYGLLAEGVQKDIQCRYLKIDEDDDFGRLLQTSRYDCIGAVHVEPEAQAEGRHKVQAERGFRPRQLQTVANCKLDI